MAQLFYDEERRRVYIVHEGVRKDVTEQFRAISLMDIEVEERKVKEEMRYRHRHLTNLEYAMKASLGELEDAA